MAQTPRLKALEPVAHAVDVELVQDVPDGHGVHSALPAELENVIGAAQVVTERSAPRVDKPAGIVLQDSLSLET